MSGGEREIEMGEEVQKIKGREKTNIKFIPPLKVGNEPNNQRL